MKWLLITYSFNFFLNTGCYMYFRNLNWLSVTCSYFDTFVNNNWKEGVPSGFMFVFSFIIKIRVNNTTRESLYLIIFYAFDDIVCMRIRIFDEYTINQSYLPSTWKYCIHNVLIIQKWYSWHLHDHGKHGGKAF